MCVRVCVLVCVAPPMVVGAWSMAGALRQLFECVHRVCHGWSSIRAIHKENSSFHIQFQFNLTFNDIKNISKSNCMHKIVCKYHMGFEVQVNMISSSAAA